MEPITVFFKSNGSIGNLALIFRFLNDMSSIYKFAMCSKACLHMTLQSLESSIWKIYYFGSDVEVSFANFMIAKYNHEQPKMAATFYCRFPSFSLPLTGVLVTSAYSDNVGIYSDSSVQVLEIWNLVTMKQLNRTLCRNKNQVFFRNVERDKHRLIFFDKFDLNSTNLFEFIIADIITAQVNIHTLSLPPANSYSFLGFHDNDYIVIYCQANKRDMSCFVLFNYKTRQSLTAFTQHELPQSPRFYISDFGVTLASHSNLKYNDSTFIPFVKIIDKKADMSFYVSRNVIDLNSASQNSYPFVFKSSATNQILLVSGIRSGLKSEPWIVNYSVYHPFTEWISRHTVSFHNFLPFSRDDKSSKDDKCYVTNTHVVFTGSSSSTQNWWFKIEKHRFFPSRSDFEITNVKLHYIPKKTIFDECKSLFIPLMPNPKYSFFIEPEISLLGPIYHREHTHSDFQTKQTSHSTELIICDYLFTRQKAK